MAWLLGQVARCLLAGARTTQLVTAWPPPAIGAAYVAAAPFITSMLGRHWQPQEHRLLQACRSLCASAPRWDKHEAQKEAFLKVLQESKDALKKLDKQIQGMLPAKDNVKNQLQKLGDQLATKMDCMSKTYISEAQKLTGEAKVELEAAGAKMKKEADKLRKQNAAVDSTAKSIQKNTKAALDKAKEINDSVAPIVKEQMDKAIAEGRKLAIKTQSEASKLTAKAKKTPRKTDIKKKPLSKKTDTKKKPLSKKTDTKKKPQTKKPDATPISEKFKQLTQKKPASGKKTSEDLKKKTKGFTVKIKTMADNFCDKFASMRKKASAKMQEKKKKVSAKKQEKAKEKPKEKTKEE